MTRVLAVADEVDESLYGERVTRLGADLVVACGDLPFDYLEYLVTMTNVPLVFVPGNHDPDLRPKRADLDPSDFTRPFQFRTPAVEFGPQGCTNVDGRLKDAAGLRIAGLGGSIRYKPGPNQYSQARMRARALALELRARSRRAIDRKTVDLLITHSPPWGVGDGDDPAHRGFKSFTRLVRVLSVRLLIHGHVHPYGRVTPRREFDGASVLNVVGHRILEV